MVVQVKRQPLRSVVTCSGFWNIAWPVRRADNLTATCEPTVYTMCDPQYLTTLQASTAWYGDSFLFLTYIYGYFVIILNYSIHDTSYDFMKLINVDKDNDVNVSWQLPTIFKWSTRVSVFLAGSEMAQYIRFIGSLDTRKRIRYTWHVSQHWESSTWNENISHFDALYISCQFQEPVPISLV
jgi:hypothetical protein